MNTYTLEEIIKALLRLSQEKEEAKEEAKEVVKYVGKYGRIRVKPKENTNDNY